MPRGRPSIYTEEERHLRKLEQNRKACAKWAAKNDRSQYFKNYELKRSDRPAYKMWSNCQANSKKKGIENTLTLEYIENIMTTHCPCCKQELTSHSLDRVNNDKGYVQGNVAVTCWPCNANKRGYDAAGHRMIADYIDEFNRLA